MWKLCISCQGTKKETKKKSQTFSLAHNPGLMFLGKGQPAIGEVVGRG